MNGRRLNLARSLVAASLCVVFVNAVAATKSSAPGVEVQQVNFQSQGTKIVGELHRPQTGKTTGAPLVIILGPVAFVKEQAPRLYAKTLAQRGYAALIFDPRYHGQSDGLPRRFESGDAKTQDIQAAIDYAQTLAGIDKAQIHLLGICQGVNWIARAAANEDRVKSVGLIAGHYLVPKVAQMYLGGPEAVKERLAAAQEAKRRYRETGEVEYIPIVSKDDKNALLTFRPIYDWYIPWANTTSGPARPGYWENRITRMSELDIWGGDIRKDLLRITIPTVMIHSNKAASGPKIPRELFEIIPARQKEIVWLEDQFQTMFYDDTEVISRTVDGLLVRIDKLK